MAAASSNWWSFRTIRRSPFFTARSSRSSGSAPKSTWARPYSHLGLGRPVGGRGDQGDGVVPQLDGRVGRQDLEHLAAAVFLVHDVDAALSEGSGRRARRGRSGCGPGWSRPGARSPTSRRTIVPVSNWISQRRSADVRTVSPGPMGVLRTARFGLGPAFAKDDRDPSPPARRLDVADVAEIEVLRAVDDPVMIGPPKARRTRPERPRKTTHPPDPPFFMAVSSVQALLSLIIIALFVPIALPCAERASAAECHPKRTAAPDSPENGDVPDVPISRR